MNTNNQQKNTGVSAAVASDVLLAPSNKTITDFVKGRDHWNGDAYDYHPKGVTVDDLVFVDEWHTWGTAAIYLATDTSEGWTPPACGRSASISGARMDALPRPNAGTLWLVYYSGSWKPGVPDNVKERILSILG